MKPHIKVIQRNGVDIFVTSSMTMKEAKPKITKSNAHGLFNGRAAIIYSSLGSYKVQGYLNASRDVNKNFTEHVDSIKSPN